MTLDLYLWGPFFKAVAFSYLSYLAIIKKFNIPILFFVVYAMGSFAFLTHLIAEQKKNNDIKFVGAFYEQYYNMFLSIMVIISVSLRK
jgi:hypothetical protein